MDSNNQTISEEGCELLLLHASATISRLWCVAASPSTGWYACALMSDGWFVQRYGETQKIAEANLREYIETGDFERNKK